jgi:hypothetical protein
VRQGSSGSCHLGPSRSDISNVACSFRHWRRAGWCAAVELTAYQNKGGARLPSKIWSPCGGRRHPMGRLVIRIQGVHFASQAQSQTAYLKSRLPVRHCSRQGCDLGPTCLLPYLWERCSRGPSSRRIDTPRCQISSHITGSEARQATERLVRIWPGEASYGASLRKIELTFPVEGALDSSISANIRENSLRHAEETEARQATVNTIVTPKTQVEDWKT